MGKSVTRKLVITIITIGTLLHKGFSQTDTITANNYEGLSLKDLLNVKIVSASKSAEMLFDAPLSASVLTREEIQKTGCSSIMEALRLVPGLIVREQSNGNYDIHLRGMDNVPPNASFDLTSNTTTLVMIDNRPIYSYLRGGTFWETLPVDLHDVEKIEVVRGPAAALYGPNAVNGVINIITRQIEKKGLYATVNNQQGSNHTFIDNASIGYRFNRLSIIASGNYQHRNRSQESYFEYNRNQYFDQPAYLIDLKQDTVRDLGTIYPKPRLSMEKIAGNLFASYRISDRSKFNFSTGMQHSLAQRVATENGFTPLSYAHSDTRYVDLQGNINGLTGQFSYNEGTQLSDYSSENKYDFKIINGNIEYNLARKGLLIKPGISIQSAIYDDRKYADQVHYTGMFNARTVINSQSASLRGEYKLLNNTLRLVGGLAASHFNYPDTTYLSFELAATWKLNTKNLLRLVYSGAPRSANIFDTYVAQTFQLIPEGVNTYRVTALSGNKNLQLLTAKMVEAGYRSNISRMVSLDVEVFNIHSKNYNSAITQMPYTMITGIDTIHITEVKATNLPMQLDQTGLTFSVTVNTKKLKIKPFATLQRTQIVDYAASINMPGVVPNIVPGTVPGDDIYSGIGTHSTLKSTPALYGGGVIDYKIAPNINITVNSYYYTKQDYYHLTNLVYNDGVHGIDHLRGKLILNASISYEPVKGLQLCFSGKNLLNQTAHEFFYTDKTPFMVMGGCTWQLK
ncbi:MULTISPECIES: TonB-dependent receptor plug domain-containing protein [Niastella]|uniref:TonB-dependent receptor n=1 Tax=Niastella soli TaxID=2821487 RepID=A0ABS3Z189_9BACT|nr:TonB-dependent receptor plug domain-containing protein [Niastella soli]MBO9203931.1 TonB-dependent receptor [Niastella soli]